MEAFFADFRRWPPLEMMVAGLAGYKGGGTESKRITLDEFRAIVGAGGVRV
jgi:hypothetical protein